MLVLNREMLIGKYPDFQTQYELDFGGMKIDRI